MRRINDGLTATQRYYAKHKDLVMARSKHYYETHKPIHKESSIRWHKEHPEKMREYLRNYELRHKEERVKRSRLRIQKRKEELVKLLGKKCVRCGYDKYFGALEFHHIDPKTKESEFEWQKKNFDITKVILVCSNCHKEIHHEIKTKELEKQKIYPLAVYKKGND